MGFRHILAEPNVHLNTPFESPDMATEATPGDDLEQQSSRERRSTRRDSRRSRRAVLATGAGAIAAASAGCLGGGGTTTEGDDGGDGTADGDGTSDGDGTGDGDGRDGDATTTGGETTTARDFPDEVVIGSIHPLSGSTAYTGTRTHQAIKLAAMVANENGGIESMDGAEVTVIESDHKNDPSLGAESARELVDEGAHVLTGTYSSAITSATATAAEGQGVPFVIDVSTAASILQERQFDYVYRTQPNSLEMARNTITHTVAAADQAGFDLETVGLFYIDQTYGQSLRDGLRTAADEAGLEIVDEESIGFGGTADTQVTALRDADPDVVIPTLFPQQFMEVVGSMQDQDYWPPIFSGAASAGFTPDNFEQIGDTINGSLSTGFRLDPTSERGQTLSGRFAQEFDTAPMESNQAMAYATAEVMIAAFEEAASTDPEVLNETLQSITVEDHVMAMPPITFGPDGENENAIAVTNQIQDHETELVYPEEFAVAEVDTDKLVTR